jgi:hypothetical protein
MNTSTNSEMSLTDWLRELGWRVMSVIPTNNGTITTMCHISGKKAVLQEKNDGALSFEPSVEVADDYGLPF